MPGEIRAAIPPELQDRLRQTARVEGERVDEIVSSALSLYLDLPQAARHTARAVQASGTPEAQDLLRRESVRAIANAGFEDLQAKLIAHGKALGIQDPTLSEEDIAEEAVEAVKAERRERRAREDDGRERVITSRSPTTGRYVEADTNRGRRSQPGGAPRKRLPSA